MNAAATFPLQWLKWLGLILAAVPWVYLSDLTKLALESLIKVGWDSRPFVSIQLSTVLVFMAYSVFVGFVLGIGGIFSRGRGFFLAFVSSLGWSGFLCVG